MTPPDPRALRNAFGTFMTGVTVVTCKTAAGAPIGFTANSFTSVSLDPPLVLVCIARDTQHFDSFARARGFAVNILSEDQKEISQIFAHADGKRFDGLDWRDGPNGNPVIADVSSWFDCAMHRTIEAGDHTILIGEVRGFHSEPHPGLGYARGTYIRPSVEMAALEPGLDLMLSVLIARDGKVLLRETADGGLSLPEVRVGKAGVSHALTDLIGGTGLLAEPGFVYAVYEDAKRGRQTITFQCAAADGAPQDGAFFNLGADILSRLSDPAMRQMLGRFADETRVGNFGQYSGTLDSGRVRPFSAGRSETDR